VADIWQEISRALVITRVHRGWDEIGSSLVVTNMDSIALRPRAGFLDRIAGFDPSSDRSEVQASSFETIYSEHYRDVSRHVILTTRGRDDVEEIVAETFARAFAAWRSGRGPAGHPLPWLLVIARRIATDRWRRRRLIAWLPLPEGRQPGSRSWGGRQSTATEPGGPDRAAGDAEFWLWLDALSQALPTRQRDVLFLRYQHDLTDEDIGEVLGLSASGVRTLVSRALNGLRSHPDLWS
jgi:RNA polymerase sigma-70 factor (ECF subfamily)